ncbi:hypothetical protein L249_3892 [Ophiocordyceps polyrhachis-furcata BCC 54312]|uniref:Uncharacterized protein n=1 Tax=Ophiocordyceps polyrhachis-furcata BCC 54312 TaxID=1330021 RepID=A0A367L5W1_9HYPO|nr:hypothetical protein L249_3892 [Ophiocordyceps polyrhachis-furcata BCC 54312]
MDLSTSKFPDQASNSVVVNKINRLLGREKERLYVGLYVRGSSAKMPGGEDEYHWAFLAGPKQHPKSGSRHIMYHAKEKLVMSGNPPQLKPEWQYVNDSDRAAMLLVRLLVGKIVDKDRLEQIFKSVPLRTQDPDWNCVLWMQDAFGRVIRDGQAISTSVRNWHSVRNKAMWYVHHKKSNHRFDGQDSTVIFDPAKPATWDMLKNEEMNP